ncbi:hypothetical protein [Franzmannia pantelleriensis]|nr:hypothetical protein [Halomonas pantelleriensis]
MASDLIIIVPTALTPTVVLAWFGSGVTHLLPPSRACVQTGVKQ